MLIINLFNSFQACFNNGQHLSAGDQWQKVSGSDCVTCTCKKDGTAHCTRVPGDCLSGQKLNKRYDVTEGKKPRRGGLMVSAPDVPDLAVRVRSSPGRGTVLCSLE